MNIETSPYVHLYSTYTFNKVEMSNKYYLPNKDLLPAIHKSKASYCSFAEPQHADFDFIISENGKETPGFIVVLSLDEKGVRIRRDKKKNEKSITQESSTEIVTMTTSDFIQLVREKKAAKLTKAGTPTDPNEISTRDLVVRVMTDEHIPIDPERKKRGKTTVQRAWTPFPPFKHFLWNDGDMIEVCRSHWKGNFESGTFDPDAGRVSHTLAKMFMLLTEKYSRHPWFRNFSYNEDMRAHALVQLTQNGLQFCESKSDNPFSFYTTTVKHCFMRVKKDEEKVQRIRDELMIGAGSTPSLGRQIENEMEFREEFNTDAAAPKKRGRRPKNRTIDDD